MSSCEQSLPRGRPRIVVHVLLRLDARADVADDRARPHDDAAHNAERPGHAIAGQIKRRGCQWMCQTHRATIEHENARPQKRKVPVDSGREK